MWLPISLRESPGQYAVMIWCVVLITGLLGGILLYLGLTASPAKAAAASQAVRAGTVCAGLSAVIAGLRIFRVRKF